ncbi:hypothetical protein SAMN06265222_10633 [Neorhodopirellula lusitana]|uniref:Secreted protein n=1 Tax=Neorhodopirellula lusitana TaxID=445327 RepID=A0ABY1Q7R1_9BACT|nr:hypothetical protein [Neorhodopirellula lusitana]SMP58289.1 hypothetical protein SAMN06265222_10633 [Neorhodopirellula lusitana]
MKNFNCRIVVLAFVACSLVATQGKSQTTDNQKFTVTVPGNISIVAPVDAALTHDESDSNQAFPNQTWSVVGNNISGVSVAFTTATPFVHSTDPSYKRDVKLGLAVGTTSGPGTWTVTQALDTTDHANSDNEASVTASSNGTASASFNLAVNFITGTYGSFPSGNYETTVVGTVTAN